VLDRFGKIITSEGPCAVYPEIAVNLIPGMPFSALRLTFLEESIRRAGIDVNANIERFISNIKSPKRAYMARLLMSLRVLQ
jgi:hypothetical protein